MHEIVFRGKRIDNGNWVYGFLADYIAGIKASVNPEYMGVVDETNFNCVDPYTVGQYTGLTDKNGRRIFEGDLLVLATSRTHEVKFADGSFFMEGTTLPIHYGEKFTIVGNIYDNPELLEASENG